MTRPPRKHLGLPLALLLALTTVFVHPARGDADAPTASSSASAAPPASASASTTSAVLDGDPAVQRAVDRLVRTIARYGGTVGALVIDVDTGRVLGAHRDLAPLNPASNMKVLTAATALWQLSPEHTIATALYGRKQGTEVGDLVLRGQGDPSLGTSDLWQLADAVRRSGIRRVRGDVLVDQSFFDSQFIPPGFEQQPEEWAYFRAPVSAVALEANTVTMHVTPGEKGDAALVTFAPEGFVDIAGRVGTGAAGSAQNITLTIEPNGKRLRARVGGSIPQDSRRLRFTRRVEDPTLFAGYVLRQLLRDQGIEVMGEVREGGTKARTRLTLHMSEPVHVLLAQLGKNSDNFAAEMLFKSLASEQKRQRLRSEDGVQVVMRYLEEIGARDEGIEIRNGSGLFDTNRLTAHALTAVLRDMYRRPSLRHEFVAHLAVAGVDGTLRWRLRGDRTRRVVRAKTGTLASVTALSGYVLGAKGGTPKAFSIIVNGVGGKVPRAREAVDLCVTAIAEQTQPRRAQ